MSQQAELQPGTKVRGRVLEFDFPSLAVGTSEYAEGPTGATVFHFRKKAIGAVDVRGGAPGAYNVDWLRWGYDWPNLDAVVVSGGSWYGLAASAGVAAALKESGQRSGHWANLAHVAGAIIYDFGERRPNEIHPDERLGAAALEAASPGRFPQGAQGAGRMTMQGSYFGLWLHSGQGGAYREIRNTKIACFTVVNSVDAVVDRSGNLHHGGQSVPSGERHISELIELVPEGLRTVDGSILGQRPSVEANPSNTTISLVVTNQTLSYAELQRLAIQVHSSMGRAIQPFGTLNDGDVLFAASTCEVEDAGLHSSDLGTVASEVMWDAILSSVPDIPEPREIDQYLMAIDEPDAVEGRYGIDPRSVVELAREASGFKLTNCGTDEIFGLAPGESLAARRDGGRRLVTANPILAAAGFQESDDGVRLVLNPGPWQQIGYSLV